MRVLLRDDVDGVGRRGEIVEVADGYGRNFLLPRGLAQQATRNVEAQAQAMRRARIQRDAREREESEEVATSLVGRPVTIEQMAGEGGRLFGSVTAADIVDAVAAQTGFELDRKRVRVDEPIRSVGTHTVMVKLHAEVEFPLTIEVVGA